MKKSLLYGCQVQGPSSSPVLCHKKRALLWIKFIGASVNFISPTTLCVVVDIEEGMDGSPITVPKIMTATLINTTLRSQLSSTRSSILPRHAQYQN